MEIDPLLLAQLQPGLSTKADVLRVLGVPTRKTVVSYSPAGRSRRRDIPQRSTA